MLTTTRFEGIVLLASWLTVTGCDDGGHADLPPASASKTCLPDVIDDFEDGDGSICASEGRRGRWFHAGDNTSSELTPKLGAVFTPTLIPEGRDTSRYAAHLQGSGFSGWGALMGFDLNKATARQTYDASAADGIKFWMKSAAPVQVEIALPRTIPVDQPAGECVAEETGVQNCYNHFLFPVSTGGDAWMEYEVPFSALVQHGSATWDQSRLLAIQFVARAPEFDFWVDDVRFYHCDEGDCVPTCADPELPQACPASDTVAADCWPRGTDCANPPDLVDSIALWGSGPDDVWSVGFSSNTNSGLGAILHWDGASWSRPSLDASRRKLWGIWGSGPNDAWAVGEFGTILHWDGSSWSLTPSDTTAGLNQGVWGSAPDDVWAAGTAGAIVHWDGSAWSAVPSASSQDLWGLWGSGASDVWAVGTKGAVVHWDGAVWSVTKSGTAVQLDGVWGSAPADVWAVGEGGTALHWGGSAWSSVSSGTTAYLDGVWGSAIDDVWAVGESGTILHWDGSAWSAVSSGTSAYLFSIWGSSANDVWAGGEGGTKLHWNGSAWSASE